MLRRLLVVGWLSGVPVALVGYNCHTFLYGLTLNVGPETAKRIRPHMTLAEVEAMISGPPGDYRFDRLPTFSTVSGCRENTVEWVTDRGRLTVVDGYYGSRCRDSDKPRGLVDHAHWTPADKNEGVTRFTILTAVSFAGTFWPFAHLRLLLRTHRRAFPPAPASGGNSLGLPRYPG